MKAKMESRDEDLQGWMKDPAPRCSAGDLFLDAIAEAVFAKVERMAAMKQRLLDSEQAAAYLGMSTVALRHKAAIGEVPVVKIDAKLRFDRRDLDRYIDRAPREGV